MAIQLFKKKEKEGISSNEINVVICRLMSDRTPIVVGEFIATQIKDDNLNLNLVNDENKFKEELERKRHHILEYLKYKLDITTESKKSRIEKIDKKIIILQDKIKNVKDGKIGDEKVNLIDLEVDLRHLKVLKYVVEYEGEGSFEIINKKGQREIRFLARDSILIPYFNRSDTDNGSVLSMFPDIGLSRKYHREIDDKIQNRWAENKDTNFFSGIKGIITTIGVVVLIIGLVIGINRTMEHYKEADDKIAVYRDQCNKQALDCAFYYGKLIESELINRTNTSYETSVIEKGKTSSLVDISNKLTDQT